MFFCFSPRNYKGIAFIMRNENLPGSVYTYSTSIDSVESLTGIDFFNSIEIVNIDSIEAAIDGSMWR